MKHPEEFIRATVRPLAPYGPPRDPAPVPLHLNESPTDLPDDLKREIVAEWLAADWSKYPITDGAGLARDLATAWGVDPTGVMVGNGSNELLQLLLLACIDPGDKIVVCAPSFGLYTLQASALGARIAAVRLREGTGFRFPVDAILQEAEGAKLILIASPNNPTGTTLKFDEASRLAEAPCLVAIDEAYRDFCEQDFAPLLRTHARLVLFRTFSKALAAASLRCGALLASPALCAELRKVQLPYNLSAFTCLVARTLVARPDLVQARVELVKSERARVAARLAGLGVAVHASGANFLLFEQVRRKPSELHAALFARGVLIRNVSSAPDLADALRVSIGAPKANDAFLLAMRSELA